jgi:cytochrome c oxidase subunit 2
VRPPAEAIGSLAWIVAAIAFVIFIGVEGALLWAAWRYRASRSSGPAPQRYGHRTLEIVWTAAPIVVLAVVAVLMLQTMSEIGVSTPGEGPASMRIVARGYQWWWEFRYPREAGDVIAANELHIPVGTPVELALESADVIHSFWVPELNGKTDLVPGRTNRMRLYAARAGTYQGQCAEFCGVEHAWMRILVVAEPMADFERWLDGQASSRIAPTGAAADGERVFAAQLCTSCHTIRGSGAVGLAGPDLTHVGGRRTIAAGVLKNTPENMRAWIADPQRYKPGSFMAQLTLSAGELDALVAYLESLE